MEGTPTPASVPAPTADSANDPIVLAGWIAVIFAPIIAVIIGFVLRSRGDRRGNPILAVSLTICAIGLVVAVILISAISGGGSGNQFGAGCRFNHPPTAAELQSCQRQLGRQLRVNP
jgi:hypothetical protein